MKDMTLQVRTTPRASKSEVVGLVDGVLRVRVAAPPIEGRANRALVSLLADALGLRARDIEIVRGEHARNKLVRIGGIGRDEALRRLRCGKPGAGP